MTKQELANKMVSNFVNNFVETFGVKPNVKYSVDYNTPTLNEIAETVDRHLQAKYPNRSIFDKSKLSEILRYRYIYFSIAREFGYTFASIGMLANKDHSTVVHGCKQVHKSNELRVKIMKSF